VELAEGGEANGKTELVSVDSNANLELMTWPRHLCGYAELACEAEPVKERRARSALEVMISWRTGTVKGTVRTEGVHGGRFRRCR